MTSTPRQPAPTTARHTRTPSTVGRNIHTLTHHTRSTSPVVSALGQLIESQQTAQALTPSPQHTLTLTPPTTAHPHSHSPHHSQPPHPPLDAHEVQTSGECSSHSTASTLLHHPSALADCRHNRDWTPASANASTQTCRALAQNPAGPLLNVRTLHPATRLGNKDCGEGSKSEGVLWWGKYE